MEIQTVIVPNEPPIKKAEYRIAIIGEAPGEEEENYHRPFVGVSGKFLMTLMHNVGIDRFCCLIGNVCRQRPPGNDISHFKWDGPEIQDGLAVLVRDIDSYDPNVCLLLGATPLRAALGAKVKISDWRGSLFISTAQGPFLGRKCVASLHPAHVLREYSGAPLLRFDLQRAKAEGYNRNLVLPRRDLIIDAPAESLCHLMDYWPPGIRCSLDIEGGLREGWPCVSVANSPLRSYTIAWGKFSESEHCKVLRSFANLMWRLDVPKVLQNQLYDNFVLSYGYKIPIRNVAEDTLIKSWAIYAELPRSLATQASIWTRQPHWKGDSMYHSDGEALFRGCAMDSAVTLEICNNQDQVLTGPPLKHYRQIIELQNVFLYMELRGIAYDGPKARRMLEENARLMEPVRLRLDESAGAELCGPKGSLSAQRLIKALYETKGYPEQYVKEAGRKTKNLTSDVEAILTLKRHFPDDPFLSDVLLHRHLEGVRETLQITADSDGRVRCGYSLEAETGRVKCYKSPTGSGANLQTIQKTLRGNYVADPGYEMFQIDLEGADGWTVACECARLGDSIMLDDYHAGLKPAKIIALLYWFGAEINDLDREELKFLHDRVFPIVKELAGDWIYLGSKRVQHGCYTGEHEVLTPSGWVEICALEEGVPVMAHDNITHRAQFELPLRHICYSYTGNLHFFEGTAISLCVTHDHKMPFDTNGNPKSCTATEMLSRNACRLPITSQLSDGESYAPIRLVAAFQADGCLTTRNYVTFHFKKQRKVFRLRKLLIEQNIRFTEHDCRDGTVQFSITAPDDVAAINRFGKVAGPAMLKLNAETLAEYVDEYPHWDGSIKGAHIHIFSSNEEHLEWIATIANLTHLGCTFQKPQVSGYGTLIYKLTINQRRYADLQSLDDKHMEHWAHVLVHCLEVPSGFLLVRRNNKIFVSGNSSYMMGIPTMVLNILKDSFKESGVPLYLEQAIAKKLQGAMFSRYPGIQSWHAWAQAKLVADGQLDAASGQNRIFFGRRFGPNIHDTVKEFLAHRPQANTTHAISLAALNLWNDAENRRSDGSLIIEPLHQIHDALLGQYPSRVRVWAHMKLRSWFKNKLSIAGRDIIIPFDGGYGPNWGACHHKL